MKAFPHNPTIFWRTPKIFGYILAFFSFLILTFITVKIFAPDISSDAATKNISDGSSAYTLSAGFDDTVSIPVTPTSSQAVYSKNHVVSVSNTCPSGATITMTSNSTASNALTRTGSDSGTKTIATTTGISTLDNDSWGYSIDNGVNYAGIPLKNGTAAKIYNGTKAETTTVDVLYGVKTDNNLPSGTYTTDVVYTAAVSPSCLTYTVHFNTDGGTTFPDLTLNYGDKLDLTKYIPTKTGYVFAGYSNGTSTFTGTETAADINPSNSMTGTLTAKMTDYCEYSDDCRTVKDATYSGMAEIVTKDGQKVLQLSGPTNGTSYVSLPSLSNIDVSNGYTIDSKATWTSFGSWSRILDINNGTQDNIILGAFPPGTSIATNLRNGTSMAIPDFVFGEISLNVANTWMVVLKKNLDNSYTMNGYQNGTLMKTQNYTNTTINNVGSYQNVWIGLSPWNNENFNGYIYYVKMTLADGTKVIDVDFSEAD